MAKSFVDTTGTTHEFPDETPDDVVERVKSQVNLKTPQDPNVTRTERVNGPETKSLKYRILEHGVRPIATGLATAGGTIAGAETGPLALPIGLALGGAVDQAIRNAEGSEAVPSKVATSFGAAPGGVTERLTDTGLNLLGNEVGGKVSEAIGSRVKPAYNYLTQKAVDLFRGPAATAPDLMESLGATASQRSGSGFMKLLEDVFAGKSKRAASENSAALSKDLLSHVADNEANATTPGLFKNPTQAAQAVETGLGNEVKQLKGESNFHGDVARTIAKSNPQQIVTGYTPMLGANGQPMIGPGGQVIQTPVISTIEGPVDSKPLVDWALQYEHVDPLVLPDKEKKVVQVARDILAKSTIKDQNGNIIGAKPISFAEAWNYKQATGELGAAKTALGNNKIAGDFQSLTNQINQAIETSIPNWKNNPNDALQAFRTSKALVQQRHDVYNVGDAVTRLVNNEGKEEPIALTENLLKNPNALQRVIVQNQGRGVNTRNLLAGQDIQQMALNSIDQSTGQLNGNTLLNNLRNPDLIESRKILYSKATQDNLENIFQAVAKVSDKPSGPGEIAAKLRIGGAAINLGASLLTGSLYWGGSGLKSGIIVGGSLGLSALAKLATKPKAAEFVVKMISGEPLGVSEQLAARTMFQALKGETMQLLTKDGQTLQGRINGDGQIEEVK